MKVALTELRKAAQCLFDHLETTGQQEFQIDQDYYWVVRGTERYDPYKKPTEHTLGQLTDDWNELMRIVSGERESARLALAWLAAILAAIATESR